ncbi:MAG: hypothetical protein V4598_06715 [Bdellovibrionota bacterium]
MTSLLALLFSMTVMATDQDIFEKSYPRDNSFCQMGSAKVEIMVRGAQLHIEPEDKMWGEFVFSRISNGPVTKLPVTSESGLYRLFQGNPSSCTKVVGSLLDGKFAVLFQKNNRPHKNQVVIQYFDPKTSNALETIHTPYLADKAMVKSNGFLIRTHLPNRSDIEMGKVLIKEKKYLFQDHRFPVWVSISKEGFSVDPATTFEDFTYKAFFKTIDEFKTLAGWNEAEKSFNNRTLYVAINHEAKSKCILLVKEKQKFTGEEAWICQ